MATLTEKLWQLICQHCDDEGKVICPSQFWQEAGFKTPNSAHAVISQLTQKSKLSRLAVGIYKIMDRPKPEPAALQSAALQLTTPQPALLFLTLKEKEAFDWLGTLEQSKIKVKVGRNEEERVTEKQIPLEDDEEKTDFIQKMIQYKILEDTGKQGQGGKIFCLNSDNYLHWDEKRVILPDLKTHLEATEQSLTEESETLNKLNNKFQHFTNGISVSQKELEEKREKLKTLQNEALEIETLINQYQNEVRLTKPALKESQLKVNYLKRRSEVLSLLQKMPHTEFYSLLEELK